jgi:hypothetical protein
MYAIYGSVFPFPSNYYFPSKIIYICFWLFMYAIYGSVFPFPSNYYFPSKIIYILFWLFMYAIYGSMFPFPYMSLSGIRTYMG